MGCLQKKTCMSVQNTFLVNYLLPSYHSEHIKLIVKKQIVFVGLLRRSFIYLDKYMFKQLFVAIIKTSFRIRGTNLELLFDRIH